MKTLKRWFFPMALTLPLVFLASCAGSGEVVVEGEAGGVQAEVVVQQAPPPARVEVRPPSPARKGYVWVPGRWKWAARAHRYVWVEGHWKRARSGSRWIPGQWKFVPGRGYVYVNGHWR